MSLYPNYKISLDTIIEGVRSIIATVKIKTKIMVRKCAAYFCQNRYMEKGDIAFYRFPDSKKEPELLKQWLEFIEVSDVNLNTARICSVSSFYFIKL